MVTDGRVRRTGALLIHLIDDKKFLSRVNRGLVNRVVVVYANKLKSKVLACNNLGRLRYDIAGCSLTITSLLQIYNIAIQS